MAHRLARQNDGGDIRVGTPSGAIPFSAAVSGSGANSTVDRVTVYRTARRLMEGNVLIP